MLAYKLVVLSHKDRNWQVLFDRQCTLTS